MSCTTGIWACTTGWRPALYLCTPTPALGLGVVAWLVTEGPGTVQKPSGSGNIRLQASPFDLQDSLHLLPERTVKLSLLLVLANVAPELLELTLFEDSHFQEQGTGLCSVSWPPEDSAGPTQMSWEQQYKVASKILKGRAGSLQHRVQVAASGALEDEFYQELQQTFGTRSTWKILPEHSLTVGFQVVAFFH